MKKKRCGIFTFYYEENDKGEKILRGIRVYGLPKNEFKVDGDIAIIEDDSVGSEQIKNGSIEKEDLNEEVRKGLDELNNVTVSDDELGEMLFPEGIPEETRRRMDEIDDDNEE